jgi:hypothetical protein
MSKPEKELPELCDEDLAFEMIEITCDGIDSLTRAFNMIDDLCKDLAEEIAREAVATPAPEIH